MKYGFKQSGGGFCIATHVLRSPFEITGNPRARPHGTSIVLSYGYLPLPGIPVNASWYRAMTTLEKNLALPSVLGLPNWREDTVAVFPVLKEEAEVENPPSLWSDKNWLEDKVNMPVTFFPMPVADMQAFAEAHNASRGDFYEAHGDARHTLLYRTLLSDHLVEMLDALKARRTEHAESVWLHIHRYFALTPDLRTQGAELFNSAYTLSESRDLVQKVNSHYIAASSRNAS